jgi:Holliday junction resolvase
MTPEGRVKKKVKELLDEYGAWYFMPYQAGFTRRGIPDIVGVLRGRMFAVETKAKGGRTTALQEQEMGKMDAQGCKTFVVEGENLFVLAAWLEIVKVGAH